METVVKAGVFLTFSCLAITAAMLVLAGCSSYGGEKTANPFTANDTILVPSGSISPEATSHRAEQKVNLTIYTAQKVPSVHGITPNNGVWVIVDLLIENHGFIRGFPIGRNTFILTDPNSGQNYSAVSGHVHLSDPLPYEQIPFNTTKRGEIIFITTTSPTSYILTTCDISGAPLDQTIINVTRSHEYWHASDTTKGLMDSSNFTVVVNQLTTPEKTLEYMRDTFASVYHAGLISYTPEVFFHRGNGDCKDFATFFSYVLAQHGYYVEMVSIKYGSSGHTVAIFKEENDQLKYFSIDKMDGFRNASSIDDLLHNEMERTGARKIENYKILPAGSVNMCTMPSGQC